MTLRYIALVVVAVGLLAAGCKQEAAPPASGGAAAPEVETAQKICPVMGGPINKAQFVDYEGRRVYFCCAGCPEAFKKDPAKYIKIIDEQIAAEKAGSTKSVK